MILNKYGSRKVLMRNNDGTYTFLNVTMKDIIKWWIATKLTTNMIQESDNAEKTSDRPKNMDRRQNNRIKVR